MPEQATAPPRVSAAGADDEPAVNAFIERVPRGEYLFLKEDIGRPEVIDGWRKREGCQVLIAYIGEHVAGLLAVIRGLGWSGHVGELRLVVDPLWRGRGVGAALARSGLRFAVDSGLAKVTTEVLADQEGVIRLFRQLGFSGEALLTDQVRDEDGRMHDVLVLAHPVVETWSSLTMLGVGENDA